MSIEKFEKQSGISQTSHKSPLNVNAKDGYSKPSIDKLAQYRGREEDTFKPETPTSLLNEYIPQPVVSYYSSHKVNTLGDLYSQVRDAWESLQTTGTNRNVGELILEDLALEETEFNELAVNITRLLESSYLKSELLKRYNPTKVRNPKKEEKPWFLQD